MDDDLVRQRLADERERLVGVRHAFDEEHLADQSETESLGEISSYDQHQADMGTETFEREKDLSILEQIEAELADVEHAIRRLDAGDYGTCEVCGRPIPGERLEVMPAARLCLEHQAAAERDVRVGGAITGTEADREPTAAGGDRDPLAPASGERWPGQAPGPE